MLLIETSQLVALHTWKNQHVYAHRAAAEKKKNGNTRKRQVSGCYAKQNAHNKFHSVFSFEVVAALGSEPVLFVCVCVHLFWRSIYERNHICWEDFFLCFPNVCVCVWCRLWKGRVPKRRSSTGWVRSTGTWCRVEIEVRQVEETDHVSFYAPAVSSMERANHQQRPLASAPPPTHPPLLPFLVSHLTQTHTHTCTIH